MNKNETINIIAKDSLKKQDSRSDMLLRELGRTIESLSDYKVACGSYAPDIIGGDRDNLSIIKERRNAVKSRLAVLISDIDIYARMQGFYDEMHDKADGRLLRIAEHIQKKEG